MCAITGFGVIDRRLFNKNYASVMSIFSSAWAASEEMGREAAGCMIVNDSGVGTIIKFAGKPWGIVPLLDMQTIRSSVGIIAHTRQSTSGSPKDNGNNHPIQFGNIAGVHNGVLYGWNALHTELKCKQQVDSEVLFALLNTVNDDIDGVKLIERKTDGSRAIAWARRNKLGINLYSDGCNSLYIRPAADIGVVFFATHDDWVPLKSPSYRLESGCYINIKPGSVSRCLIPVEENLSSSIYDRYLDF